MQRSSQTFLQRWVNSDEGVGPDWSKLTRVCACVGWAVHGIIFEFENGRRSGVLLDNAGSSIALTNFAIRTRGPVWRNVEPGDYIVRISGHQLVSGAPAYLCHTLKLNFASGSTLSFAANHLPWKGDQFVMNVPANFLVNSLVFFNDYHPTHTGMRIRSGGSCRAFHGIETSIHLPIDRTHAHRLPRTCKQRLKFLLLVAQRVSNEREEEFSLDAWWSVLSFMTGYDLLGRDDTNQSLLESLRSSLVIE